MHASLRGDEASLEPPCPGRSQTDPGVNAARVSDHGLDPGGPRVGLLVGTECGEQPNALTDQAQ